MDRIALRDRKTAGQEGNSWLWLAAVDSRRGKGDDHERVSGRRRDREVGFAEAERVVIDFGSEVADNADGADYAKSYFSHDNEL